MQLKTVGEFLLHNDISVYIALFEAKPRRTETEILKELSLFLGKDDFEIPLEKLSLLKFCNAPAAAVLTRACVMKNLSAAWLMQMKVFHKCCCAR